MSEFLHRTSWKILFIAMKRLRPSGDTFADIACSIRRFSSTWLRIRVFNYKTKNNRLTSPNPMVRCSKVPFVNLTIVDFLERW